MDEAGLEGLSRSNRLTMAAEGVGRDLVAAQQAFFDAGAVDFLNVVMLAVEGWQDLLDGLKQALGSDLAHHAFVAAFGCFSDAVATVVIPPGLDGAPGELAAMAVLIAEGHLADSLVAFQQGCAIGVFERAEHAHFEIIGDAFHMTRTKLGGTRLLRGRPFCVAAKNHSGGGMGDDVKSAMFERRPVRPER